MVLDRFMYISLDVKHFPFYQFLHAWRSKILGQKDDLLNGCFWNTAPSIAEVEEPGAVRILVCGNTGVGKSSLINKVFGNDDATEVASMIRGRHQITEEITWKGRPELVIHDSNGFEAGGLDELDAVKNFLRDKSSEPRSTRGCTSSGGLIHSLGKTSTRLTIPCCVQVLSRCRDGSSETNRPGSLVRHAVASCTRRPRRRHCNEKGHFSRFNGTRREAHPAKKQAAV